MGCRYNTTDRDTFSIFVTTYLLPREEINRGANTYQNFLNKDGTPKSRNRHEVKGKYTLSYYQNKIVDDEIKRKFDAIRKYLKNADPSIQEEYTKRRLSYWVVNRCLYTLEPHRKTLYLRITGARETKGFRRYSNYNKTYFLIKNSSNVKKILARL